MGYFSFKVLRVESDISYILCRYNIQSLLPTFYFDTRSHEVIQAGLELVILGVRGVCVQGLSFFLLLPVNCNKRCFPVMLYIDKE